MSSIYTLDLILPPGRKAGCLPRKYGVGQVCSIADDQIEILPDEEIERLAAEGAVDWSPFVLRINDQGGDGSCAQESTTKAEEIVEAVQGNPDIPLNPLFGYHFTSGGYKVVNGSPVAYRPADNGSNIDENLVFLREFGACPESVWPRSKGFYATPSAEAIAAAGQHKGCEFLDIISTRVFATFLLKHGPVVWGASGHSCVATKALPGWKFRYANSYDPTWGDKGFGILAYSSVNYGYGAWGLRTAKLPQTIRVAEPVYYHPAVDCFGKPII